MPNADGTIDESEKKPEVPKVVKWDYLIGTSGINDFWVKAIEGNPML